MNIETLDIKLDSIKTLFDAHQIRQDEQFANLKEYLLLKIDSERCENCSVAPKVKDIEIELRRVSATQYIIAGALIIIEIIVPYILPQLLGTS